MFDQVMSGVYVRTCECVSVDLDEWEGIGMVPMSVTITQVRVVRFSVRK
jgi:hypothetical protein